MVITSFILFAGWLLYWFLKPSTVQQVDKVTVHVPIMHRKNSLQKEPPANGARLHV
jgi:hypothetical protein